MLFRSEIRLESQTDHILQFYFPVECIDHLLAKKSYWDEYSIIIDVIWVQTGCTFHYIDLNNSCEL